ncbi:MAG: S-layer homology domain-containing protein [Lachnospiraceae bacterium]|nr:S-layer homology domain-containing protein [Lachnospiraceae bacterium]
MHKRFIRKTIACLLAGILAAAVLGELTLTEQVFGAEDSLYYDESHADEILPDEVLDADEAPADEIADTYESGELLENDIYGSDDLSAPDDEAEECDVELKPLFYEDCEHAYGGIVPVIWNTSDISGARSDLEGFTEEIVGKGELPSSYINPTRSGIRLQEGNACWVHSMTTSAEMSMISAGMTDKIDYSEKQILYGYFNQIGGDKGIPASDSWQTAPGSSLMAAAAVANHIGFGDENDFPVNEGITPLDIENDISHIEKVIFLGSWSEFNTKDLWKGSTWKAVNESVKAAILQYGSCAITCNSNTNSLNQDTYGFYTAWSGNEKPKPDHSLTAIGWDDEKVVAAGVEPGAFYVQNSWGSTSFNTEKGYNWVSYYDASLGTAAVYVPEHESPGTLRDEDVFSYSGTGFGYSLNSKYLDSNNIIDYSANVFEPEHDEIIDCVGIYTTAASNYHIYVMAELDDETDPESGKRYVMQSGKTEGKGFFKIHLKKSIEVAAGDKFAVVVSLQETGTGDLVAVFEGPTNNLRSTSCAPGQSYVKFKGNSQYRDCATHSIKVSDGSTISLKDRCGNACIYAYGNPKPEPEGPFPDVPYNHVYASAITWAVERGITKGYSDGTFGINRICTRGDIMMFLWRYAGCPQPKYVAKSPFSDVPKTHAYYKAILWGSQRGITKGYDDGTFGINKDCTRGHIMMFIWRYQGCPKPKSTKNPFKDSITAAFRTAVIWAYENKVAGGFSDGTFRDTKSCTRGEAVKFLHKLYLRT